MNLDARIAEILAEFMRGSQTRNARARPNLKTAHIASKRAVGRADR
jgi:hypothetical protein